MIYWNKFVLNLAEYTPKLTDDIAKKKQKRCQCSVCSTADVWHQYSVCSTFCW